ncbi:hypothetical protein SAMN05878494_3150 [Bacillus cereus]|nr:hypothetical protein SAMN05878494_3150 [Bacillus cereus]
MATEKEIELAKQILAKLTEMDNLNGKISKSVEGKLDDLQSVHKGLQATFEQGFADVHKELGEIKQIHKDRESLGMANKKGESKILN